MYNFVDVQFSHLEVLSKLFKTKNINIGSKFAREGCDTCDYGPSYSLTIYISDASV